MAEAEEHRNGAYARLGDEEAGGENAVPVKENSVKVGDGERSTLSAFPGSIKYLIWNEFCERFCFYGMKTILALYLVQHLRLSENESTELVHLFIVACYATPIIGAFLSDCVLGKYRTILYLSVVYCLGNWVMALSAFPEPDPKTRGTLFWSTSAALGLIAFGTGGIKPCGAAFGGDQIQYTLPDGPMKERIQRQFFSMYYLAVNVGSFFSTVAGPYFRIHYSYSFAFAVPAVFMMGALLIFWFGRKTYYDQPPQGNVFAEVGSVVVDAVKLRERRADGEHWLDSAKAKHSSAIVEDVKGLMRVLVLLLPTPIFWALFDQQSSKWVFQASTLDGNIPWFFNITIQPDQMQALNPILIAAMIPLFDFIIYPFFESRRFSLRPISRMVTGMILSSLAFLFSGLLQQAIDSQGASNQPLSILWQIPQYVVMTAGEIMFSITGLEFAYSQAPDSMKAVVQAAWLFTVSAGNFVTVALVAIIGTSLTKANEFYLFAGGCFLAMLLLLWGGSSFVYRTPKPLSTDPTTESLLVHAADDRVFVG
ncbi:hypothetical protein KC19_3G049500 [Ceratodon purpureus]|uniref:Uncharacterized protein n=1 Tax=Ceratodon purpureus TaxID=3225 RepID=A0A8T0IHD0_CERPU|nr:hypothetical protein KC19_3G049500 [Ceratodon purpureus]